MATRKRDDSLGKGVYFASVDYVGIARRIAVIAVDGFVLTCLIVALTAFWFAVVRRAPGILVLSALGLVWFYLAVLKPSKVRTVGYWLLGCRIVDLRGQQPSILRMTFRSILWVFGPFNLLFDLIWCGIDDDRQSLRDRFVGTCVVRNRAVPIGNGEIHLAYFNAMGYALVFPRVVHPKSVVDLTLEDKTSLA